MEPDTLDELPVANRAELARLVPELPPAGALSGGGRGHCSSRRLARLARLGDDQPVLLVVEDV